MASQEDVARHLDLTSRRVRDLVYSGVLPSSKGKGGYDVDGCRIAYIRYLRGVSSKQVKGGSNGDDAEEGADYRELFEKEKHRELKRENDIAEGLVAPVSLLTDALTSAGSIAAVELDALPMELKRAWPEMTGDQVAMVKKTIAKCRNAIADMKIEVSEC